MIICSCQAISDQDIHAAIDWMRASDPNTIITPGKIYHALGKAPDCGGCMKLFVQKMRQNSNLSVSGAHKGADIPDELRGLKQGAPSRQIKNTR